MFACASGCAHSVPYQSSGRLPPLLIVVGKASKLLERYNCPAGRRHGPCQGQAAPASLRTTPAASSDPLPPWFFFNSTHWMFPNPTSHHKGGVKVVKIGLMRCNGSTKVDCLVCFKGAPLKSVEDFDVFVLRAHAAIPTSPLTSFFLKGLQLPWGPTSLLHTLLPQRYLRDFKDVIQRFSQFV